LALGICDNIEGRNRLGLGESELKPFLAIFRNKHARLLQVLQPIANGHGEN
jgi:hypothetical protein